jgi:CheY-like chemotaxis protein
VESLAEIRKAAMRGRELVQQILSFSRRQPTAKKPLDLVTEAHDSVRLLRALLPGRVQLKLVSNGVKPTILADRTQLQQVIVNLVTNAAHAMGAKEGVIQVKVGASTLDVAQTLLHPSLVPLWNSGVRQVATVAVIDNGSGMDAATQSRIFEPFFTTKPVGEGTGLGLSVVHGIVKEHGGVITLTSTVGLGTTFTVYFPIDADLAAIADARIVTGANTAVAKPRPKPSTALLRLCYLDDDEALGFLVGRQLERRGFAVTAFTSQQAALDAFAANPQDFDAFVTDYNMPGKSGLDVAVEVMALRPGMRVAIVSGYVDEELNRNARLAGVVEVIFKADMTEDLCNAIERFSLLAH